ncbi:NucA/NucB deoxyribonuclease domain-containing protein [Streptomyces sp. NPDC002671]
MTGPLLAPGLSCDEYPFAFTKEGGTTLSSSYRGWAWVPGAEQSSMTKTRPGAGPAKLPHHPEQAVRKSAGPDARRRLEMHT